MIVRFPHGRIAAALVVFLFGVTASAGARSAAVTIDMRAQSTLFSYPVQTVVRSLPASSVTVVRLESTDAIQQTWTSCARFKADATGTLDLSKSKPLPTGVGAIPGDCSDSYPYGYVDPDAMGLFETMKPPGGDAAYPDGVSYRWWNQWSLYPDATPRAFELSVFVNGQELAARTIARTAAKPGVTVKARFFGTLGVPYKTWGLFFRPATAAPVPAVVIFGGSEGGLHSRVVLAASLLAAEGYATLALAYFDGPGVTQDALTALPDKLFKIPLENMQSALAWLAQPEQRVNWRRIFVSGTSRGSEAALLLGAYFKNPDLVYGVLTHVGSAVVVCSPANASDSAWQIGGQDVGPCYATNGPGQMIDVGRIEGPVFLDCGVKDKVWPYSCTADSAIVDKLKNAPPPNTAVGYSFPKAGHGLGGIVPYEPSIPPKPAPGEPSLSGDTPVSNQAAYGRLWPLILAFLRVHSL